MASKTSRKMVGFKGDFENWACVGLYEDWSKAYTSFVKCWWTSLTNLVSELVFGLVAWQRCF